MLIKHPKDKNLLDVAVAFIIVGAIFTSLGVVWSLVDMATASSDTGFAKLVAGLVIMGLGYIQMQLELIRRK